MGPSNTTTQYTKHTVRFHSRRNGDINTDSGRGEVTVSVISYHPFMTTSSAF